MKAINPICVGAVEVLPLVEGGKGIAVSTGVSAGHWAAAGGVGTVSLVNADSYDETGRVIPQIYRGKTRRERHEELISYAITGGIAQLRIANDIAQGRGRLHVNVLWEMAGAEHVLTGVLDKTQGQVHGITCGAGMPYRLSEIATRYNIFYYPIVSSARAFNALWRRSYHKYPELLGGVVYEDPWKAGGHNGLSNNEDPMQPQDPLIRVLQLRQLMNASYLNHVPIIMAGGVWWLKEWEDWINNPGLGPIAFQFGTRPLLTQESQIPYAWKQRLTTLKKGDIFLNKFSPTGFYSSAVNNAFMRELRERSKRQVSVSTLPQEEFNHAYIYGSRNRQVFMQEEDLKKVREWERLGFTSAMLTPDSTMIFVSPEKSSEIHNDQIACMGCLSACQFSNWSQTPPQYSTSIKADPRSFCIQKTLQSIAHCNEDADADKIVDDNLMFGGTNAWRFATDPFYNNSFIPTVDELIERILTGY